MRAAVSDEKLCKNVSLLIMAPPLAHYKHTAMEGLATSGAPLARDRMWNNLFCLPRSGHHLTVYVGYASYTIVSMEIASLVSCVPTSTNVKSAVSRATPEAGAPINKSPKEISEPA